MLQYLSRRAIAMVFALFGLSVIIFVLIRLVPGDTVQAILGQSDFTKETLSAMRAYLGLDQPIWLQYVQWLGRVVHGDWGSSWRNQIPVTDLIGSRLPVTLELTVEAMLVSIGFGVPAGLIAARWRDSAIDGAVRLVSILGLSIPEFFTGILLILVSSRILNWTPSVNYVSWSEAPLTHVIIMLLPALAAGAPRAGTTARMTRACLLDVLSSQYVLAARAKGLSDRVVIYKHALRSALVPIIAVVGLQVGYLLGGALVVEVLFSLPGAGRLLVLAVTQRDYPLVQGLSLTIAFLFLSTNLLVDVLYSVFDPRIRHA
jgi:peptide/nickel transport system permease protein